MSPKTQELTQSLLDIGAIKFGAFRLKAHEANPELPLSPIYVDLRVVRSYPNVLRLSVTCMEAKMREERLKCDRLADLPTAGTAFATLLMDRTNIPMITPRQALKTHGVAARVEGFFKVGDRVLMIDDLATKADTKIEAAATLRGAGLTVTDAVVVVDRKQGAGKCLAPHGIRIHSILNLPEMLSYYRDRNLIPLQKFREVQKYLLLNLLSLFIFIPHIWGNFFNIY